MYAREQIDQCRSALAIKGILYNQLIFHLLRSTLGAPHFVSGKMKSINANSSVSRISDGFVWTELFGPSIKTTAAGKIAGVELFRFIA